MSIRVCSDNQINAAISLVEPSGWIVRAKGGVMNKLVSVILPLFGAMWMCSSAWAYTSSVDVHVGYVQVGDEGGLSGFRQANSQPFPGCEDVTAWVDDAVSAQERIGMLVAVLYAKSKGDLVRIYYHVDADSYCRVEILGVV